MNHHVPTFYHLSSTWIALVSPAITLTLIIVSLAVKGERKQASQNLLGALALLTTAWAGCACLNAHVFFGEVFGSVANAKITSKIGSDLIMNLVNSSRTALSFLAGAFLLAFIRCFTTKNA